MGACKGWTHNTLVSKCTTLSVYLPIDVVNMHLQGLLLVTEWYASSTRPPTTSYSLRCPSTSRPRPRWSGLLACFLPVRIEISGWWVMWMDGPWLSLLLWCSVLGSVSSTLWCSGSPSMGHIWFWYELFACPFGCRFLLLHQFLLHQ